MIAELVKRLKASDITLTCDAAVEFDSVPTEEMKQVAREIAKWCLWRWDGFLGFRAGSDRQAIMRDAFPPPPSPRAPHPSPPTHACPAQTADVTR